MMSRSAGSQERIKAYIKKYCRADSDTRYLRSRGIWVTTAHKYHIGFNPENSAVIIPTTSMEGYGYLEWLVNDPEIVYRYEPDVPIGLFNARALTQEKPVFLCENALDALSVEQLGGHGVGLNIPGNVDVLMDCIACRNVICRKFYISFGNTRQGREASVALYDVLTAARYQVEIISPRYRDINEDMIKETSITATEVVYLTSRG